MTIEELSARLEKVERANRRMRAGGIAILVLVAAGVAMAGAHDEVLQAKVARVERIEILEPKSGAVVGRLEGSGGFGRLHMASGDGKRSVEVVGGGPADSLDNTGLKVRDASGDVRIRMEVGPSATDTVSLEVTDPFQKDTGYYPPRVEVLVREHRPAVVLFGADGKEIARLPQKQ